MGHPHVSGLANHDELLSVSELPSSLVMAGLMIAALIDTKKMPIRSSQSRRSHPMRVQKNGGSC